MIWPHWMAWPSQTSAGQGLELHHRRGRGSSHTTGLSRSLAALGPRPAQGKTWDRTLGQSRVKAGP